MSVYSEKKDFNINNIFVLYKSSIPHLTVQAATVVRISFRKGEWLSKIENMFHGFVIFSFSIS